MSYTPKRLMAWHEVHERIRGDRMADGIEVASVGSHGGSKTKDIVKKLREDL